MTPQACKWRERPCNRLQCDPKYDRKLPRANTAEVGLIWLIVATTEEAPKVHRRTWTRS